LYDQSDAYSKLFSLCRHEIINHLQVISGLAQLNKTEKIQSCVRKVSEEMHQLGRLASCGDARLALLIYETVVKVPENSLSVECNGTMPVLSTPSLEMAAGLLAACKDYLLGEKSVPLTLQLRGGDVPSVSLRFSSAPDEQPDLCRLLENAAAHNLIATMDNEGSAQTLLLDKQW